MDGYSGHCTYHGQFFHYFKVVFRENRIDFDFSGLGSIFSNKNRCFINPLPTSALSKYLKILMFDELVKSRKTRHSRKAGIYKMLTLLDSRGNDIEK